MANKSHMASEFYIDLSNAIFVLEQEEVYWKTRGLLNQSGVIRGMPTARRRRYGNGRRKQDREGELKDDEVMSLK